MKSSQFNTAAEYYAALSTTGGAAFPLSMPLNYYEGADAVATYVAPWIQAISQAGTSKFVVLYQLDSSLNLQPGLYAYVGNTWMLAILYQYIDTYVLNGGTTTLYINITKTEVPPAGAEIFHNGVLDEVGTIPTGNGVWAALLLNSTYVLPAATATTLGGIKVGDNLNVAAGVLSVPVASAATAGVAKVGANLEVNSGVLSVASATSAVAGVVKIGAGLTANAGIVAANVVSVANRTGAIALTVADVSGAAPLTSPHFGGYPIVQAGQNTYKLQVAQQIDTYQHPGPIALDHTAVYMQLGGTEAAQNDYRMIGFGYVYNASLTDVPPAMMGFQTTSQVGDWDSTCGDLVFATRVTKGKTDQPTVRLRVTSDGRPLITNDQTISGYTVADQELVTKKYISAHASSTYVINLEWGDSQVWQDNIDFYRVHFVPFDIYIPPNLEGSQFWMVSANGGGYPFFIYNEATVSPGADNINNFGYPPGNPIIQGTLNVANNGQCTVTPDLTGGGVVVKKGSVLIIGNGGNNGREYAPYSVQIITQIV